MSLDDQKREAGYLAAETAKNGMILGLGTGSTVYWAIQKIAEKMKNDRLDIRGVSTSYSTSLLCAELGIPLLSTGQVSSIDLAIDGADEVDPLRNLIKGRGAAHTLEKVVASMAKEFIVVADSSKKVDSLGGLFPVPVEVLQEAVASTRLRLENSGASVELRSGAPGKDGPLVSDCGHFVLDAKFSTIENPTALEKEIKSWPGVVESGLFCRICTRVIIAGESGLEEF